MGDVRENEIARNRKLLLGMGFCVQGLRCFPWMGVNFFLKDGLKVDPSTLQILQNSANLPMVAKPFYGIISDSCYIFGQHRVPYIVFGALLQAVSWISIAALCRSGISFFWITFYLLVGNLGASIVEVANDAMVAETTKPQTGLHSFVWMASSVGGVLGNLIGGFFINLFSPQIMFSIYGILLLLQFFATSFIRESSLNLPKSPKKVSFSLYLSELAAALKKPEIFKPVLWFSFSYAVIPSLTGTMFYYQTQMLRIESSVLGISKVFGQAAMLLWGVFYNQHLKSVPSRKLISAVQISMVIFMLSDYLFVTGVYSRLGVPNSVYVIIFSGLLEVLYFFKILPFTVLMAKICPLGCEGSIMAFVMSTIALSFIVSGYFGVALSSFVGDDFSGLPRCLVIQCVCTLFPVFWSNWIPNDPVPKEKKIE